MLNPQKAEWFYVAEESEPEKYDTDSISKNRLPNNLLKVPFCRQSNSWSCGVSSLQSILYYFGYEHREDTLAKLLKSSPDHGTNMQDILSYAKSLGFNTEMHQNCSMEQLQGFVDKGIPPMVCLQAWSDDSDGLTWPERWEDGHYVVVIGYDSDNIYVMDPSTLSAYAFVPRNEFFERWHDYDENGKYIQTALLIWREKVCGFDENLIFRMK